MDLTKLNFFRKPPRTTPTDPDVDSGALSPLSNGLSPLWLVLIAGAAGTFVYLKGK